MFSRTNFIPKNRYFYIKSYIKLFLAILLCLLCFKFYATAHEQTVVKIGFPIQHGMSYVDEKGNYKGYLVDYLNQLNLFTNWKIEYVQVDGDLETQLSKLTQMLENGEIDVLGTMNKTPELEKKFLYPNYSYGTVYNALVVKNENYKWIKNDFSNWDNIKVATYPGYSDIIEQFDDYAKVNDFSYQTIEFKTYEDMIYAVNSGIADAMIQVDIYIADGFRTIGRFYPKPYYFAITKQNTKLLYELNSALRNLNSSQPNLQNELYDFYFTYNNEFKISDEHRKYIKSFGTLKVLFFSGNAPYQYIENGKLKGFAVEYIERFSQITGLQYEPIIVDEYKDGLEMIENGQVDIIACIATNSTLSSFNNVRFTLPFFNSFSVTACTNLKPNDNNSEFWVNTELGLEEILNNNDYSIKADYYSLSYYLRKEVIYDKIKIDSTNIQKFSYSVGVTNNIPEGFVTLLNQYASSMSNDIKQAMLYSYSSGNIDYTLKEWLIINRVSIIISIIIIICLSFIFLFYYRNKHNAYKALLAENRIMHLAMYDDVTGAYNETQFCKILEEICQNKEPVVLVAFNIRKFKYINDTYGIKLANNLLCEIKCMLDFEIQDGEIFCRPSADLFYLMLKEQNKDKLICRLNNMFNNIHQMAYSLLDGYPLSFYCGAVFVADSPSPFDVSKNISFVMAALANSKKLNCSPIYVFDDALYRSEKLQYYIETHMQSALTKQEYKLYLQPKMNLKTGCIDSAEALVRWQSDDIGIIYPDKFIPLFEQNGFCVQLDLYMIEQVCKQLRCWIDSGLSPIMISVNQTKSLFVKENYIEELLNITKKYNISPKYIILEILEGLAFENIDSLNNTIKKLNSVGFKVSMDDFGSGYSSLNTLGKLQINELKLDRMFLMDIVNQKNNSQYEVLESILSLSKKLGIKTVAEGVETKQNEDIMRSMCCDYCQGYYYSKPIPANEFKEKFLC